MRHLRKFNSGRVFESNGKSEEYTKGLQEEIISNKEIENKLKGMSEAQLDQLYHDIAEVLTKVKNESRRHRGRRIFESAGGSNAEMIGDAIMATGIGTVLGSIGGVVVGTITNYIYGEKEWVENPAYWGAENAGGMPSQIQQTVAPFDSSGNLTSNGVTLLTSVIVGAALGALSLMVMTVWSYAKMSSQYKKGGEDVGY